MKGWIFAYLFLKKFLHRDLVKLILQHVYPHKFQTWWLRNERINMMREYKNENNNKLFIELVEKTEILHEFLDQYRHESGSYYTDTYDCSYYLDNLDSPQKVCECGECGGTIISFWCNYVYSKNLGKWYIDSHMDGCGRFSPLELSNSYSDEFTRYQEGLEYRRLVIFPKRPIPKVLFSFNN